MDAEEHWARVRIEITKKLLMKDKARAWMKDRRNFLQRELDFLDQLEKEVEKL